MNTLRHNLNWNMVASAALIVAALVLAPSFASAATYNTPQDYWNNWSPTENYSNYSPTDTSTQYSPSSSYSNYSPTQTYTDYSPSNYTSTYSPSSYTSTYSPSDYYSNYSPYDSHNSACATPGSCSTTSDNGNTVGSYNPCATPGSCSTTVTNTYSSVDSHNDSHNVSITNPTTNVPFYSSPTCNMQVTPTVVAPGQYANLTWASSNAKLGTVNGFGTVAPNGTVQLTPTQPMTFTGTFTGLNGQIVTCSAAVTVSAPAPVYHQIVRAAQRAPYVTLSEVPYTGLDLGPVGTALYWGFLVLWCAFMAYIIAVKRVHYRLARTLKGFLYGTDDEEEEEESIENIPAHTATAHGTHTSAPHTVHSTHYPLPTSTVAADGDPVDEFILTQIHRSA